MKTFTKITRLFLASLFLCLTFNHNLKAQVAGAALNFNGTNNYITTSSVTFGSNWTVEGWIRPTNINSIYWNAVFGQCFYNNGQGFVIAVFGGNVFVDGPLGPLLSAPVTSGAWTHIALTCNNGIFAFYKNGILVGNQVVSGYANSTTPFIIGARTQNGGSGLMDPYEGDMDDIRIWNTTRTQCEILSYMKCEISTVATGLISNYHFNQGFYNTTNTGVNTLTDVSGYSHNGALSNFAYTGLTSNWTAPGGVTTNSIIPFSPLPEINVKGNTVSIANGANSPVLTNHTNFGAAPTRTFLIESLGTHTLNLGTPFFVGGNSSEFTVTVPPSTLLTASTGTSNFVVAFTPTSLGVKTTTVYIYNSDCDEPVYKFAITATATAGAALNLDGVNDYLETNANLAELGQGDFTLEAWIKTTAVSQGIITCGNTNTTWEIGEKCFYLDASGRPAFVGFGNNYILSTTAVNDGNWHHVAVTWDYFTGTSGSGRIYVDGVNQTGSVNYSANNANIGTFKIGKQNYNGSTPEAPNSFKGLIDEVRIWNRALCLPEIINNLYCELPSPTSQIGLNGYYRLNSGIAFGVNTAVTAATDNSTYTNNATLTNFGLSGENSNWYAPGAVTSGSSCSVYLDPEINLVGNGTNIVDGKTTTSTSDGTGFGTICMNTFVQHTFTVQNLGTAALTVSSLTMSGSGATSFSLSVLSPASPIAAGSTATFAITFTPSSAGTKTATLIISNNDCSEAVYDVVVSGTCNALPVVSANTSNSVICNTFTTSVSGSGADTYTWTGSIPATNGIAFAPNATADYSVAGTNTLTGCTSTNIAVKTITVNALPSVTATTSNATLCSGVQTSLNASGANTYSWSPGPLTGANVNVTPFTTTTYTLFGQSLAGCTSTTNATVLITVNPLPTVSINPLMVVICAGATASLSATGADNYTWNPGGLTNAIISPSLATFTSYTLTGQSLAGCSSTNLAIQDVTVNALPSVTASASSSIICNSQTLSLIGQGADTYTWSPNVANATPFSPSLTTSYTLSGSYTLTGCTNTNLAIQTISVNANPTLSLVAANTTICAGSSSTLTASNAATYTWNPGNFTTAVINPSPASTTVYTLTGTSSAGCASSNMLTQTIIVNALPLVTASVSNASVCESYSTSLSGGGASTYIWTGGVINGVSFTPTATASYTVTGTDVNLCTNKSVITVTVNLNPIVSANITSTAVCIGSSLTLAGSGATSYTWSGNIIDNQSFAPLVSDSYSVIGTSSAGCTNSAVISVTVNALPIVIANVTNSFVCYGSPSTLSGSGAATYSWTSGVTDGVAFTPNSTTSYTVTGTDNNFCSNTATISISVTPGPTVSANITSTAICIGSSITLSGSGAASYSWSGSITDGQPFSPLVSDTYTVIGTNFGICTNSTVVSVTVNNLPTVIANISNSLICKGDFITLSGAGAATYSWSGGIINNISYAPTTNDTYTVTGVDANGCKNTASISVTVLEIPNLTTATSNSIICAGESVTLAINGANTYSWNTGETTESVTVNNLLSTTNFTVIGTGQNGCVQSVVITQKVSDCTGIDNVRSSKQFKIYPNPSTGSFIIESLVETDLTLLNEMGQIVLVQHISEGKNKVDLSEASRGIYFLKTKSAYFKIVKQ